MGVPNGTALNAELDRTGYVLECPVSGSDPCVPLTSNGGTNPLYFTGGELDSLIIRKCVNMQLRTSSSYSSKSTRLP